MLSNFTDERIDVGGVILRIRHGGAGPPVLLIHGHPRTGSTWFAVVPLLVSAGYSVIVPGHARLRPMGQGTDRRRSRPAVETGRGR